MIARRRRAFSFAAIVLVLVSVHLLVIRAVSATRDDAMSAAWAIQGARAEAGLDSALHIAAGELLGGRTPPATVTLPDNTALEIRVDGDARPWEVTISARSGESYRLRTFTIE
ncbi:MAG: hypothetical protein AAGH64_02645 [Planctomycetota bacterium]